MVLPVWKTIETPQLQYVSCWSLPCCAGRALPVVVYDRRAWSRLCRIRGGSAVAVPPVVDVAVLCSDKLSRDSQSATDSVHRRSANTTQQPHTTHHTPHTTHNTQRTTHNTQQQQQQQPQQGLWTSGRILPDTPYSALLGSTVDTCYCRIRIQRNACSSVVHAVRQSRSFLLVTIHLALCSLWFSGPDALHHGRYGPEGQLCSAEESCRSSIFLS